MSIIIEQLPQCDECHYIAADYQSSDYLNNKELRKDLKKDGWLFRDGKDICPECVKPPTARSADERKMK